MMNICKHALVVIDYQHDFIDGSLAYPDGAKFDMDLAKRVWDYGEGCCFYTMDTHHEDYLRTREGKSLPIIHCIENTPGWSLYGNTGIALQDVKARGIKKGMFPMTHDEVIELGIPADVKTIELAGLVSNICVISNVVMLYTEYPNAKIIVNSTLTGSADSKLNQATFDILRSWNVEVI